MSKNSAEIREALNETTGKYEAPVAKPETYLSGQEPQFHPDEYTWNESSGQWDRVEMEYNFIVIQSYLLYTELRIQNEYNNTQ